MLPNQLAYGYRRSGFQVINLGCGAERGFIGDDHVRLWLLRQLHPFKHAEDLKGVFSHQSKNCGFVLSKQQFHDGPRLRSNIPLEGVSLECAC